ncbi:MAG: DEAD/DEAH box helicase, partial [Planctomycetes bacterium]|nr:DEAD/DEAH box helicase [Planctomycetota bacterium]
TPAADVATGRDPLEAFSAPVQAWFRSSFAAPTPPQAQGWAPIAAGESTLVLAPTGSGKTLAAFLAGIDRLMTSPPVTDRTRRTRLVYLSPLRALAVDVEKNLRAPLLGIAHAAERLGVEVTLPTVGIRTGDTPADERRKLIRNPPDLLITTPESLYLMLTSAARETLAGVDAVIVDEIHALAPTKRGAHLALSLERLEERTDGPLQRIGLSATQRPLDEIARFLGGHRSPASPRPVTIVDAGVRKPLEVQVRVPVEDMAAPGDSDANPTGRSSIWPAIHPQILELIRQHRSTIVFVNARRLAERLATRLNELDAGGDARGDEAEGAPPAVERPLVKAHHGSLSRTQRLAIEDELKRGDLRGLVATSSLELGIDIGDVDLVVQIGPTPAIAAFLQRVGRAGHGIGRLPKGRLFPLTRDDLVACTALLHAVRTGDLDRTAQPQHPLDILAQQAVAIAACETIAEDELFALARTAWPFRELPRDRFEAVLAMHAGERTALLHRDSVHRTVRGTRRARLCAITCGGAIPEVADWQVVLDHDDTPVGTVHEDFAIESSVGDVFQLGATSWQIRRIGSGRLRVTEAPGVPPSLPFWIAEGPSRSAELCAAVAHVRERGVDATWLQDECGIPQAAAEQLAEYLRAGAAALGAMPTQGRLVLERFFDETGGQQLVLHSPFGSRINRAFGLALRKRFCVGFGYELQAAATEEAVLISLGPMHSFPLEDVWQFLHPGTATEVLTQALLPAPMFAARWRWNVTRSLLVERFRGGKKVPAPLLRFRADDALAAAFPAAQACPETLPPGPIEVPQGHPVVDQTIADCMFEAMDLDGFLALLQRVRGGDIGLHVIDGNEPSPFAAAILHAMPYAFLDDAPLEERRTQAVAGAQRGARSQSSGDRGSDLDPAAVATVQEQCWPDPRSAEELHEALGWMGWLDDHEVAPAWREWLDVLAADGRALHESAGDGARWFAAEASREPLDRWRGRLEAQFPVYVDAVPEAELEWLRALEAEGTAMRARCAGRELFGHRRLLARARNTMLERLRAAVQPVSPAAFAAFLPGWQHVGDADNAGPRGLGTSLHQLATAAFPAREWESEVLPRRVHDLRREHLDQVTLSGEFVWLRLWGRWRGPLSRCPISIVPRAELSRWLELPLEHPDPAALGGPARTLLAILQARGAVFPTDLETESRLLPSQLEEGLSELVGQGFATCDSFATMRQLAVPPSRRRFPLFAVGRWSLVPWPEENVRAGEAAIELVALAALRRFGVVSHTLLLEHKFPVPWRLMLRALRGLELRGEARGGRFVSGWAGEQYALPAAVSRLRASRPAALAATFS